MTSTTISEFNAALLDIQNSPDFGHGYNPHNAKQTKQLYYQQILNDCCSKTLPVGDLENSGAQFTKCLMIYHKIIPLSESQDRLTIVTYNELKFFSGISYANSQTLCRTI